MSSVPCCCCVHSCCVSCTRTDNRSGAKSIGQSESDWNRHCRGITDSALGDVVYIFDCCYAITTALDREENEYLVASSMESMAGSMVHGGFSQRLIDMLKDNDGAAMSVTMEITGWSSMNGLGRSRVSRFTNQGNAQACCNVYSRPYLTCNHRSER